MNDDMTRREVLGLIGAAGIGIAAGSMPLFGVTGTDDLLRQRLPRFSALSLALLRKLLDDPEYSGTISGDDAASLARNEKMTGDELMVALLPLAQSYSRAPVSNFYVGVVVRGASGSLYTGANIEIPGQCLGFAVHAEQSAISNAYMHGEKGVNALAVGAAPCGHCRQFMEEASPDGEILILTPTNAPRKLSVILPEAFGPAALGMKEGAFPVRETPVGVAVEAGDTFTWAALEAARK